MFWERRRRNGTSNHGWDAGLAEGKRKPAGIGGTGRFPDQSLIATSAIGQLRLRRSTWPLCALLGDCVSNATDQGARGLRPVQALQGAVGAAFATGRRNFNEAQVPSFSSRARVFPRFFALWLTAALLLLPHECGTEQTCPSLFTFHDISCSPPDSDSAVFGPNIVSPSQSSASLDELCPRLSESSAAPRFCSSWCTGSQGKQGAVC